jgi:hypothetical protein
MLVASGFGSCVVCYTGDYTEIVTINRFVNRIEAKKTTCESRFLWFTAFLMV